MILDADMLRVFNLLFLNTRKLIDITRHADVRFLRKDLERMKGDKLFFIFICLFVFFISSYHCHVANQIRNEPNYGKSLRKFCSSPVTHSTFFNFEFVRVFVTDYQSTLARIQNS